MRVQQAVPRQDADPGKGRGRPPLPLAMAAVTVAGQCRERSPADLAVFGADAARFTARFAEPAEGEALLAEAVREGVAEREAELLGRSGSGTFRVALWRQRGGERIRILACFAELPTPEAGQSGGAGRLARGVAGLADLVRLPLAAIAGFAERLRHGGGDAGPKRTAALAGDILAASWRLARLADDLALMAELDGEGPPLRMGEVEVVRLTRRILRLAEPLAAAADVTLEHELGQAAGPSVLADEATLWSAIEGLVMAAVAASGRGGAVRVDCEGEGGDLVLRVQARGDGGAADPAALRRAEATARANGAELVVTAERGLTATLTFPKERWLTPV